VLGLERLPIVDFVYFGARPDGTGEGATRKIFVVLEQTRSKVSAEMRIIGFPF
jgi:hypothetical protein